MAWRLELSITELDVVFYDYAFLISLMNIHNDCFTLHVVIMRETAEEGVPAIPIPAIPYWYDMNTRFFSSVE